MHRIHNTLRKPLFERRLREQTDVIETNMALKCMRSLSAQDGCLASGVISGFVALLSYFVIIILPACEEYE